MDPFRGTGLATIACLDSGEIEGAFCSPTKRIDWKRPACAPEPWDWLPALGEEEGEAGEEALLGVENACGEEAAGEGTATAPAAFSLLITASRPPALAFTRSVESSMTASSITRRGATVSSLPLPARNRPTDVSACFTAAARGEWWPLGASDPKVGDDLGALSGDGAAGGEGADGALLLDKDDSLLPLRSIGLSIEKVTGSAIAAFGDPAVPLDPPGCASAAKKLPHESPFLCPSVGASTGINVGWLTLLATTEGGSVSAVCGWDMTRSRAPLLASWEAAAAAACVAWAFDDAMKDKSRARYSDMSLRSCFGVTLPFPESAMRALDEDNEAGPLLAPCALAASLNIDRDDTELAIVFPFDDASVESAWTPPEALTICSMSTCARG
jgi:hypothetical protein